MTALYKRIAEKIITDITEKRLKIGQRLLPMRQFASQQQVSLNTILSCYRLLESQGYVEARPKSGFYIKSPTEPLPLPNPSSEKFSDHGEEIKTSSLILKIHASAFDFSRILLGVSLISPELMPISKLQQSLRKATKSSLAKDYTYSPIAGEPALTQAICKHEQQSGFFIRPDEMIITNGCMDAVASALDACTNPGDTVMIPSPCHSGLMLVLARMQRKVIEVPADTDGFDLDIVESLLIGNKIQAMVVTAVCQNPLGFCLPISAREQLVKLAKQYSTPIIEDDVYGEAYHGKQRPLPLKTWDKHGWVLYCSSFSKVLTPAYRIGWCIPGRFMQTMLENRSSTFNVVNTPLQLGMADFLVSGHYARHLRVLRENIIQQVRQMSLCIARHFPPGTAVTQPQGGYVLWVQLPDQVDGLKLFESAARDGINIIPGIIFSVSGRYKNNIRLNAGWPWSPSMEKAIVLLGEKITKMQKSVPAEILQEKNKNKEKRTGTF